MKLETSQIINCQICNLTYQCKYFENENLKNSFVLVPPDVNDGIRENS